MSSKLQKNTVILDVRFRRPGATKKAEKGNIDFGADKDRMNLSKKLFESDDFKRTVDLEAKLKGRVIRPLELESPFRKGTYLIPVTCLNDVYPALEKVKEEYEGAADRFVENWDNIVEDARKRLGNHFKAQDYPSASVVRQKFSVEWQLLSFDTPDQSKLGEVLYKQELEKAQETWREAEQQVVMALRESMSELVGHLVEKLQSKPDGSKNVLRKAAVDQVTEFLDNFSKRNIMDDDELNLLVEQARQVMKGKDVESLKNEDARLLVGQKLKKVAKQVDKLIVNSKRKISFDDGE